MFPKLPNITRGVLKVQHHFAGHAAQAEAEVAADLAQVGEARCPHERLRVTRGGKESVQQQVFVGWGQLAQLLSGSHQRLPQLGYK